jgi:hypothetical protein
MSRQGCPGLTAAQLFGSSLAARQDHARCSSCSRLSPETGMKFGRRDKGWAWLLAPLRTASVLEMRNADRRGGRAGGCRTPTGQLIGAVVTVLPEPESVRPTSPAGGHRTINSPPGGLAGGGAYLPRPQVPLELLLRRAFKVLGPMVCSLAMRMVSTPHRGGLNAYRNHQPVARFLQGHWPTA